MILEKTIRIPRSLSVKAASVLKGFLNKNPADRLGCNRNAAFMDIVNHPFFKSIDWEAVSFTYSIKTNKKCEQFTIPSDVTLCVNDSSSYQALFLSGIRLNNYHNLMKL